MQNNVTILEQMKLEEVLLEEQAGFRLVQSIPEQVFNIKVLIVQRSIYNIS